MTSPEPPASADDALSRVVETAVRLGIVLLLAALCFQILVPFAVPVAWGIIIAVALRPVHDRIATRLGGRTRLASGLLTIALLGLLIVPAVLFAGSIFESASTVAEQLGGESFTLPPPPETVRGWPVIGERVYTFWSGAAANLGAALSQFAPEIRSVGGWLLATSAGTGIAFLQFLISIIIAGVLLATDGALHAANAVTTRIAGAQGQGYVDMAAATVRSVCVGILGVAVIQAALIGVGLVAVGVPHAGLWAALCLFLAILQLPPALVVLPTIFYVFSTESTLVAVLFTIWETLAGTSDNVLKPLLLARGVAVPMLVIFLGSIGGFISFGFIGLFIGAVVLSLGYELFMAWLGEASSPEEQDATGEVADAGRADLGRLPLALGGAAVLMLLLLPMLLRAKTGGHVFGRLNLPRTVEAGAHLPDALADTDEPILVEVDVDLIHDDVHAKAAVEAKLRTRLVLATMPVRGRMIRGPRVLDYSDRLAAVRRHDDSMATRERDKRHQRDGEFQGTQHCRLPQEMRKYRTADVPA